MDPQPEPLGVSDLIIQLGYPGLEFGGGWGTAPEDIIDMLWGPFIIQP